MSIACLIQAHLSVEKVKDDGLRGVIATVDAKEGDDLALLPSDLVLEVGSERHTSVVSVPSCMHVILCPAGPPDVPILSSHTAPCHICGTCKQHFMAATTDKWLCLET